MEHKPTDEELRSVARRNGEQIVHYTLRRLTEDGDWFERTGILPESMWRAFTPPKGTQLLMNRTEDP